MRSTADHLGIFKDRGKPRKLVMGWPVLGLYGNLLKFDLPSNLPFTGLHHLQTSAPIRHTASSPSTRYGTTCASFANPK
jgi:hypothetical protein